MASNVSLLEPLDVIVVGAGIAGLTAAIAIRRAGHNVKIYEQSDLSNESGAAIHLPPNSSRILLDWGMDPEGSLLVKAKSTYIAAGDTLNRVYGASYNAIESTYGAPWFFAHRADFHTELKRMATSPGLGKPAVLSSKSRVVDYDLDGASVTFADSTKEQADLIVAADGVHSLATQAVLGYENTALRTDESAFRFLIPRSVLAADPETASLLDGDDGRFVVFTGKGGKRLVWYPCRNNTLHNFVGIFHDKEKDTKEDWNAPADIETLLNEFHDFHPSILAICKKATAVKKWPLLFRPPISPWHRSTTVLVGDAAHPMLPHQGQGGAQAIEDSAALGIVLSGPSLTKSALRMEPALLSQRLHLFEQIRHDRASAMQIFSNAGQDQAAADIAEAVRPFVEGKIPTNPAEFIEYNFGYDVVKDSCEALRRLEENGAKVVV